MLGEFHSNCDFQDIPHGVLRCEGPLFQWPAIGIVFRRLEALIKLKVFGPCLQRTTSTVHFLYLDAERDLDRGSMNESPSTHARLFIGGVGREAVERWRKEVSKEEGG